MADGRPRDRRRAIVLVALLGTIALGLWLRWFLAGVGLALPAALTFPNLRHAHSHLGYYAVLVPLAWLAWESSGKTAPLRRWERALYAIATIIATIGFIQRGYGLLGIVGSTIVGGLWIVAAWRIARAARQHDDPMVAVLPGTLLALACIPLIARTLRSDPAIAAAAVQSFLTALLFLVVAPGAVTAFGLRQRLAWGSVLTGTLSALALGLWPTAVARVGLALHALYWLAVARRVNRPVFALPWYAAAGGLVVVATGIVPLTHDVAMGAIHFLILGPFLSALAQRQLLAAVPSAAWWLHHAAAATMSGSLIARGAGVEWPWLDSRGLGIAAAVGGSGVVLWWAAVLALPERPAGSVVAQ